VALAGIDSFKIVDTQDGSRPVHSIRLGRGIPIVEHLRNLDRDRTSYVTILLSTANVPSVLKIRCTTIPDHVFLVR